MKPQNLFGLELIMNKPASSCKHDLGTYWLLNGPTKHRVSKDGQSICPFCEINPADCEHVTTRCDECSSPEPAEAKEDFVSRVHKEYAAEKPVRCEHFVKPLGTVGFLWSKDGHGEIATNQKICPFCSYEKPVSECCGAEIRYQNEGRRDEKRWCMKCNGVARLKPVSEEAVEIKFRRWDFSVGEDGVQKLNPNPNGRYLRYEETVEAIENERMKAAELERKGKELCDAYGKEMIKTHELQAALAQETERANINLDAYFKTEDERIRLKAELSATRALLKEAYVENQNMHTYVTVGGLNACLNRQTGFLREALKGE